MDQVPSYRIICRFRVSEELTTLVEMGLAELTTFLRKNNLIDDVSFIDGTKILADANKFTFVWKKDTIRFDKMNREQLEILLGELYHVGLVDKVPADSELDSKYLNTVINVVEDPWLFWMKKLNKRKKSHLTQLNNNVEHSRRRSVS